MHIKAPRSLHKCHFGVTEVVVVILLLRGVSSSSTLHITARSCRELILISTLSLYQWHYSRCPVVIKHVSSFAKSLLRLDLETTVCSERESCRSGLEVAVEVE